MATKRETRTCVFYDPESAKAEAEYGCMGTFTVGRSDSPYCPRCRANEGYWTRAEKRRPGSMRRYRAKLSCRHSRLNEWAGLSRDRKGNVVHLADVRKRKHG